MGVSKLKGRDLARCCRLTFQFSGFHYPRVLDHMTSHHGFARNESLVVHHDSHRWQTHLAGKILVDIWKLCLVFKKCFICSDSPSIGLCLTQQVIIQIRYISPLVENF